MGQPSALSLADRLAPDISSRPVMTATGETTNSEQPAVMVTLGGVEKSGELRVSYETMTSPGGYPDLARDGSNYDLVGIKRVTPYDPTQLTSRERKKQITRIQTTIDRHEQIIARFREQLDKILASDSSPEEKTYARQAMNENISYLNRQTQKYREALDKIVRIS